MVYREPITGQLVFEDVSYYILVPFSGTLAIVSLVKSGNINKTNIIRKIKHFKKTLTLKKLKNLLSKKPFLIITCLDLTDKILFSKYNKVYPGPKISKLLIVPGYILSRLKPMSYPAGGFMSELTRELIESLVPTAFMILLHFGPGIIEAYIPLSTTKFCLNFGCYASASQLNKLSLLILSSFLGSALGYLLPRQRSKSLVRVTFWIWLFLCIAKNEILEHYNKQIGDKIRSLLEQGYTWEEIIEMLDLYPAYQEYIGRLLERLKKNEQAYKYISNPSYSTSWEKISRIFISNNELDPEARRAIENLCIFDKSQSSYISYNEVIIEPKIEIETYKFMACKSGLFRSSCNVNPVSS